MPVSVILAKILPQKYLADFLDGNLYMNTDKYFTKSDSSDALRSDPHEGADEALQISSVCMRNSFGNWKPIGGVQSPLVFWQGCRRASNILCMYMLTDEPDFYFDERVIGFGDLTVLITDLPAFIRRYRAAAQAAGKQALHAPVEYIDKCHYHGSMGPFRKFAEYQYQSEFRFVLLGANGESREAVRLPIGDIRDITTVMQSTQLPDLPELKSQIDRN